MKNYLRIAIVSAFALIFVTFLTGCQKDENLVNRNDLPQARSSATSNYADSLYLAIEGNLNEPDVIWKNVDVYYAALHRMRSFLSAKDNRLSWEIQKGEEIKISENIFLYVTKAWKRQNELLASGDYELVFTNECYGISLKNHDPKPMATRALKTLKQGTHSANMKTLIDVYNDKWVLSSYLTDYIDCINSDFSVDGIGNASIQGSLNGTGGFCGYYCCNACFYDSWNSCSKNLFNYKDNRYDGGILYESIDNNDHLPLITLRNRSNY